MSSDFGKLDASRQRTAGRAPTTPGATPAATMPPRPACCRKRRRELIASRSQAHRAHVLVVAALGDGFPLILLGEEACVVAVDLAPLRVLVVEFGVDLARGLERGVHDVAR